MISPATADLRLANGATGADTLSDWRVADEPYYTAAGDEVEAFEAAHARHLPVMLKGPTGCGKTRFVEYVAWKLGVPLITVACHEDLTAGDLIGRFLLDAEGTRWQDGPLTRAVRFGAICYLDEVVEARADTTVLIHPLTDARRQLPLAATGELLHAHPDFRLVVSYNPGYHGLHKTLKPSTRQRFTALEFGYPDAAHECAIVMHESGVEAGTARQLVALAERTRRLAGDGLDEGASTRMLIHAGALIAQGLSARSACRQAVAGPLTDDREVAAALIAAIDASFA
ncbi:CbbQ/NirQ/NorQ/GpvN family protein [Methyloversatilis sp.]|uniref:CbbQ/NirQ/NorQ/GpvN family protein n=1 Tax=Methyloversatilis sp. TaxID=2569862 RepID=UPI002734870A|nr:CbbQ/NirQ/NorQ/GpvN family protein [Methyloversatilis sp.]MDP2867207.1 CbbQ/NirQ/NorQ/GpvN family protein [Methyloversatilis sp.]MDP3454000.1 CbbQ/NirQ/NorQ/GpvN family protein [Methyloversatilis sp.]MDP3578748.1 CbbQ/NirQ/NorQ/GpvN family protein [Methyloversatilis sp.]